MFNTKFFLLFYFMWIEVYTVVQGDCQLNLTAMGPNRPQFSRRIGSRTVPFSKQFNTISLFENDELIAHCARGFVKDPMRPFYSFRCMSNGEMIENDNMYHDDAPSLLSFEYLCKNFDFTMFQSETAFDWCNQNENLASFIMSIKNTDVKENIAEICFDFAKMAPKVISYISAEINENNLSFINNQFQNRTLKEEIIFTNSLNQFAFRLTPELIEWETLENFHLHSLIPDIFSNTEVFDNISPIVWWHNLRVMNWNRFMNALHERSKTSAYKIYAGTGGVVTAPLKTKFENVTFIERRLLHGLNQTIPAYIWNVLHEINGAEEFVVIGYNSPYFEFFNSSEIIFCRDICEEIPWLKEVSYYFKYSFLGRIFCCSLNEAKQSGIFEGVLSVLPEKRNFFDITITPRPMIQNDFDKSTEAPSL